MENNKENIKEKSSAEESKNIEVASFRVLIETILDYYAETSTSLDQSESWKKGTEYEKRGLEVPDDVNESIKSAFKSQLKKFTK